MEVNDVKTNLMTEKWFSKVPTHGLDSIAGNEELIKKLKEELKYQNAEFQKFKEMLQLQKSSTYFFYGAPGNGVGYAARAFARELVDAGMVYMEAKGSEFHSRYVGEGEKNIALLFECAKNHAPSVLVIDEVEQICANRSYANMAQYMLWLTNAFLCEYNRISESNVTVIVMSNQPWNVDEYLVDHAKCIRVDVPDFQARKVYFESRHQKMFSLEEGLTYEEIAERMDGYRYSDINAFSRKLTECIFEEFQKQEQLGMLNIEAIGKGQFVLTRSMFEMVWSAFGPVSISKDQEKIEEFEKKHFTSLK